MRLTWMLGMVWMVAANAAAANSLVLRVYMQDSINVNTTTLAEAQWVAFRIFGAAGIRVEWKVGDPHHNETAANRIQLDSKAEIGIEFKAVAVRVWHPSVEAYDVLEKGQVIGRIYLDMFPRPNKYRHFATNYTRAEVLGKQLPEGTLICNFTPPNGGDAL